MNLKHGTSSQRLSPDKEARIKQPIKVGELKFKVLTKGCEKSRLVFFFFSFHPVEASSLAAENSVIWETNKKFDV